MPWGLLIQILTTILATAGLDTAKFRVQVSGLYSVRGKRRGRALTRTAPRPALDIPLAFYRTPSLTPPAHDPHPNHLICPTSGHVLCLGPIVRAGHTGLESVS